LSREPVGLVEVLGAGGSRLDSGGDEDLWPPVEGTSDRKATQPWSSWAPEAEAKAPFYFREAETLKGRIDSRRYHPGEIIASEKELAREFGVSTIKVKQAMHFLLDDGFVVRESFGRVPGRYEFEGRAWEEGVEHPIGFC
jgi:Bacterial regulatory proteins, gntR family